MSSNDKKRFSVWAALAALQQSAAHVFNRTALNNHTLTGRDRLFLFWVAILSSAVSSLGQILSHWWDNPSFCHPATHKKRKKVLKCFGGGAFLSNVFTFSIFSSSILKNSCWLSEEWMLLWGQKIQQDNSIMFHTFKSYKIFCKD